jgi:hypothetical protein
MTECDHCGTEHSRSDSEVVVSEGQQWLFCSDWCKDRWRDKKGYAKTAKDRDLSEYLFAAMLILPLYALIKPQFAAVALFLGLLAGLGVVYPEETMTETQQMIQSIRNSIPPKMPAIEVTPVLQQFVFAVVFIAVAGSVLGFLMWWYEFRDPEKSDLWEADKYD